MRTIAIQLALAALGSIAWACGEAPNEAGSDRPPESSSSAIVPASKVESEPLATPITIDKGDGCTVVIREEGHGRAARIGDEVTVEYVARVKDAETPFASTSGWSQPCRIALGSPTGPRTISGLTRGLEGLKAGTKATITVPPELAYGKTGVPSAGIPADATLVFDVEISGVR
jgi:FKBP-type peptidyl-prolyl cis-trans isomerase